jgi:hypothetical protein
MGNLTDDAFTDANCKETFSLGEKLVRYWKQKKRTQRVEKKLAAFKERMSWLMTYRKDEWPYEYNFWKKNKGLK